MIDPGTRGQPEAGDRVADRGADRADRGSGRAARGAGRAARGAARGADRGADRGAGRAARARDDGRDSGQYRLDRGADRARDDGSARGREGGPEPARAWEPARDRDRDASGRPRNSRPRDGLGRPLPRGATGEPVTPDDLELSPREAVLLAQQLIDDGRPFHAHEVLEATWKAAPPPERNLWQGLAQIAVGLTHARRGNARGAVALLRRGASAVAGYGDEALAGVPAELDAAGAARGARALADLIAAGDLNSVSPAAIRVDLTS